MIPQRYAPAQSSVVRKSRVGDGKPSMLPKPRRPGSTDRLSTEGRRPSTAAHRSSSAEPSRSTFGGARLSREASASKLQINGRSRSQQGDRFGQSSMTPMRSSQYSARPTTTPQRTPSEDRRSRNWQTSLDRALAFVNIKDARATSTAAWQRAATARVQEALAARGAGAGAALVRPLTIARFVDIAEGLLLVITGDTKLNNDNYVAKLLHLSKRLLYPGTVSKSWLKTVNTLHAFPHALALISYLLDLVNHIELPVCDEMLYVDKDELACLRREYLYKCWIRFQDPGYQFEDLNKEYLQNLQILLGNDEQKIAELQQLIIKYETCLEQSAEEAARRDEARLQARRDALLGALRAERAARREAAAARARHLERRAHLERALRTLDVDIDNANAESQQLKLEVESQTMSVADRTKLLDEIDYALRVQDSKRALAEQIAKMVLSKETELALWQKKTLDSCVEYKQGLIHLSAQYPDLGELAIDEKELMGPECCARVSLAAEALQARARDLGVQRAAHARERGALARRRAALRDELETKISELKSSAGRSQQALAAARAEAGAAAARWAAERRALRERLDALAADQRHYAAVEQELHFWDQQDRAWRSKLDSMREYIESKRAESAHLLDAACARRTQLVRDTVSTLTRTLEQY